LHYSGINEACHELAPGEPLIKKFSATIGAFMDDTYNSKTNNKQSFSIGLSDDAGWTEYGSLYEPTNRKGAIWARLEFQPSIDKVDGKWVATVQVYNGKTEQTIISTPVFQQRPPFSSRDIDALNGFYLVNVTIQAHETCKVIAQCKIWDVKLEGIKNSSISYTVKGTVTMDSPASEWMTRVIGGHAFGREQVDHEYFTTYLKSMGMFLKSDNPGDPINDPEIVDANDKVVDLKDYWDVSPFNADNLKVLMNVTQEGKVTASYRLQDQ